MRRYRTFDARIDFRCKNMLEFDRADVRLSFKTSAGCSSYQQN